MIVDYLKRQDILLKKYNKFAGIYVPIAIYAVVMVVIVAIWGFSEAMVIFAIIPSMMLYFIVKWLFLSNGPASSGYISGLLQKFQNDPEVLEYFNAVIEAGVVLKQKQMNYAAEIGWENIRKAEQKAELEEISIQHGKIEEMLAKGRKNSAPQTNSSSLTQQAEK